MLAQFIQLMESKAERIRYQLIEAAKLARQVKPIIRKQAKETDDQIE